MAVAVVFYLWVPLPLEWAKHHRACHEKNFIFTLGVSDSTSLFQLYASKDVFYQRKQYPTRFTAFLLLLDCAGLASIN